MTEQVIPNTDDQKVAILSVATHFANTYASSYSDEGENTPESWKSAFKDSYNHIREVLYG